MGSVDRSDKGVRGIDPEDRRAAGSLPLQNLVQLLLHTRQGLQYGAIGARQLAASGKLGGIPEQDHGYIVLHILPGELGLIFNNLIIDDL